MHRLDGLAPNILGSAISATHVSTTDHSLNTMSESLEKRTFTITLEDHTKHEFRSFQSIRGYYILNILDVNSGVRPENSKVITIFQDGRLLPANWSCHRIDIHPDVVSLCSRSPASLEVENDTRAFYIEAICNHRRSRNNSYSLIRAPKERMTYYPELMSSFERSKEEGVEVLWARISDELKSEIAEVLSKPLSEGETRYGFKIARMINDLGSGFFLSGGTKEVYEKVCQEVGPLKGRRKEDRTDRLRGGDSEGSRWRNWRGRSDQMISARQRGRLRKEESRHHSPRRQSERETIGQELYRTSRRQFQVSAVDRYSDQSRRQRGRDRWANAKRRRSRSPGYLIRDSTETSEKNIDYHRHGDQPTREGSSKTTCRTEDLLVQMIPPGARNAHTENQTKLNAKRKSHYSIYRQRTAELDYHRRERRGHRSSTRSASGGRTPRIPRDQYHSDREHGWHTRGSRQDRCRARRYISSSSSGSRDKDGMSDVSWQSKDRIQGDRRVSVRVPVTSPS